MFWRSRIRRRPRLLRKSRSQPRSPARSWTGTTSSAGSKPPDNVDVKPRVTGYLVGSHFRDGQYVRRGQLLFTIDARPARAQLDQARAQLARAAGAGGQRPDGTRPLAHPRGAEGGERRGSGAAPGCPAFGQCRRLGRRRRSFARVSSMSASLGSCAPISGQVSERRVDPGNAVTADETVLTTVVSTNPLHFAFDGSEALLLRFQRQNGSRGSAHRSASGFRTKRNMSTPAGSTSSTMP